MKNGRKQDTQVQVEAPGGSEPRGTETLCAPLRPERAPECSQTPETTPEAATRARSGAHGAPEGQALTAEEGAALLGKPQPITKRRPATRRKPITWVTADNREKAIGERFRDDTKDHEMTVLLDQGLYRHLRFRQPDHSAYWFDLITWPGNLLIKGDLGDTYSFSREPDMIDFFRGKRINPHYWSQKLDAGRASAKEYSEDLFRQLVVEHFVDTVRYSDAPRGLGKAIREEVLNEDLHDEREARELLEAFEYEGFAFGDVWEWDFHDYDWSFLWACYAIQWGVQQYTAARPVAAENTQKETR